MTYLIKGSKRLGVNVEEKTIMMVGSTGAGKTTLVDGMINYVTDVSFEDDFRFTMVDLTSEEKGKESNQVLVVSAFLYVYFTS